MKIPFGKGKEKVWKREDGGRKMKILKILKILSIFGKLLSSNSHLLTFLLF
jgi:hypothetical protein